MIDPMLLRETCEAAIAHLGTVADRHVGGRADRRALIESIGRELPDEGVEPARVIGELHGAIDAGLVASAGPRYFGFVTGGSLPAALAADWLVSAWDQNGSMYVASPGVSTVEDVTASWILDLLGLPPSASVGFTTGCHMANFTALAAARHEVLRRVGYDVEQDGMTGAPAVSTLVGDEVHVSVVGALRLLGFGAGRVVRVGVDEQGAMRPDDLARVLRSLKPPAIVCAQAGNVNTGACDPLERIAAIAHEAGTWLHVDGAFGLWAAASPPYRALVVGLGEADSWATDAHKWLNVPYDSGIAIVRHPAAHRAAMSLSAAYLVRGPDEARDGMDWTPEASRRARAVAVYAALRSLGRQGVADLVDRCCVLGRRLASHMEERRVARVLNEVVLNQVLLRFEVPGGGSAESDALTRNVIGRVQEDGTCWVGGTTWRGMAAMRVSVSNWATTAEDIDRSADALARAAAELQP